MRKTGRAKGSGNTWSYWEKRLEQELEAKNFCVSRIPERIVGMYGRNPIKKKSDVDFVFSLNGRAVWCDAKVTEENLWNLKEHVFNPKKIHQWSKLLRAHQTGNLAGYFIWFRKHSKICWVPVACIDLAVKDSRFSIHPESPGIVSMPDDRAIDFDLIIPLVPLVMPQEILDAAKGFK